MKVRRSTRKQSSKVLLLVVALGFSSCRSEGPVIRVTQSNEITLQQWQTFLSPDGRFSIDFPAKPLGQSYQVDNPTGKLEVHSYKYAGSAAYSISYIDYPLVADHADIDAALDQARDSGVRQVNGRLIKEAVISIQGHPGRLILVDSPNGGPEGSMITNKYYLVGRRFYSMQVAIPKNPQQSQSLAAAAEKFLDSFRLINASTN